jgi:uncharacterized RDD family membrane protein YckC
MSGRTAGGQGTPGSHGTPGAGKRLAAFGLDYLVVLAYLIVLGCVSWALASGATGRVWQDFLSSPSRLHIVAFCTTVLPVGAYFTLLESSPRGATLGKRRMHLRVVRLGGGRLSLGRALLRSAVKLLPWQLAHMSLVHIPGWPINPQSPPAWVVVGMGLVWGLVGFYLVALAVRSDRRTPYDWAAGSQVVTWDACGPRC